MGWELQLFSSIWDGNYSYLVAYGMGIMIRVPRKKCGIRSHIPRIECPRYIGDGIKNTKVALHDDAFDNRLHGLRLHAISDVW